MNIFAKSAMLLSFAYYSSTVSYLWVGQLLGLHNEVWYSFGFPEQSVAPPVWLALLGVVVGGFTLASLGRSYWAMRGILAGGATQDFRDLAANLRRIAFGLIGFWFGYNLMFGALPIVLAVSVDFDGDASIGWDPLDIDVVFAILGIVFLAISRTLHRAWEAEEENKQFL